ncbi:Uncharacterised protein [Chlamydia abortus]|uniref:Uncharacterized protein n=1 Tax=Paenibacillus residui TaxID=629724 RepID=A0ABW3DET6_9BACL|nr:Uncharacterised protein [Chlamydia abortus]
MKKVQSISFQIDVTALQKNRLLTLYKRLLKNRALTRFCREAFIEKADRYLNGLDQSYAQLNKCIKAKGIEYVLEAIQEKEAGVPKTDVSSTDVSSTGVSRTDESVIQKVAEEIKLAIINELQKESSPSTQPINSTRAQNPANSKLHAASHKKTITATKGNKDVFQDKPDLEKLKALLS